MWGWSSSVASLKAPDTRGICTYLLPSPDAHERLEMGQHKTPGRQHSEAKSTNQPLPTFQTLLSYTEIYWLKDRKPWTQSSALIQSKGLLLLGEKQEILTLKTLHKHKGEFGHHPGEKQNTKTHCWEPNTQGQPGIEEQATANHCWARKTGERDPVCRGHGGNCGRCRNTAKIPPGPTLRTR